MKDAPVKTDSDTWFNRTKDADTKKPEGSGAAAGAGNQVPWLKYLLIAVGVGFVLWLILAIIRGLSGSGGGRGYDYASGGGGGGGGGFMRGFLGGLVGAAAGMWLYNSFFGGGASSAWGGDQTGQPSDAGAATDSPASTQDQTDDPSQAGGDDWSGSGGDYSDTGGDGGDLGGGGGGDWGGDGGDW